MQEKWIRYELVCCYDLKEHPQKWRRAASERVGTSATSDEDAIQKLRKSAKEKREFDNNLKSFIDLGKDAHYYRILKCEVAWATDIF